MAIAFSRPPHLQYIQPAQTVQARGKKPGEADWHALSHQDRPGEIGRPRGQQALQGTRPAGAYADQDLAFQRLIGRLNGRGPS